MVTEKYYVAKIVVMTLARGTLPSNNGENYFDQCFEVDAEINDRFDADVTIISTNGLLYTSAILPLKYKKGISLRRFPIDSIVVAPTTKAFLRESLDSLNNIQQLASINNNLVIITDHDRAGDTIAEDIHS